MDSSTPRPRPVADESVEIDADEADVAAQHEPVDRQQDDIDDLVPDPERVVPYGDDD